ncbi:cysteine desulfurase sulfur acceptor subunit CsdE [Vibrio algicola]|uniref:Cysteine desulfurase sulfur acceptor subunit CsdE n=1 Tax=Vibrio algicola TaxID=2662262 RepID=A0A5Q0TBE8_9VIBR|nr:cysteine desulfurase sulfur acceptor subunit CsdE [Vibrio algicola]
MNFPSHPFGIEITEQHVIKTMQSFTSWEDRYRQVIMWGKLLPKIPPQLKQDNDLVSGCESQVWLLSEFDGEVWHFFADSDARIVRGLISLVLAAFNHKTQQQIDDFDTQRYFEQLGLIEHLSETRGDGLRAIVDNIKSA